MKFKYIMLTVLVLIGALIVVGCNKNAKDDETNEIIKYNEEDVETIYLAGGCFWGVSLYEEG